MVETDAQDSSGYWFRGLALEGLHRPGPALEAYRDCRDSVPKQLRLESGEETPAGLIHRIRFLEGRLARSD